MNNDMKDASPNGEYFFQKTFTDSIYCQMTNASFPDFTGANALKTTCTYLMAGTSVENFEKPGVEIYAKYQELYINSPNNGQLSIFDLNGRLVVSKHINSGTNSIQLNNTGVYLVKLTSNEGQVTKKVLVGF